MSMGKNTVFFVRQIAYTLRIRQQVVMDILVAGIFVFKKGGKHPFYYKEFSQSWGL